MIEYWSCSVTTVSLYRPFRARDLFVLDQGFREALHPWLNCGRAVGALVSGPGPDELIVTYDELVVPYDELTVAYKALAPLWK
jgi:hypothetical protein